MLWILGIYLMPFPHSFSFDTNFRSGSEDQFSMYKTLICNIVLLFLLTSKMQKQVPDSNEESLAFMFY